MKTTVIAISGLASMLGAGVLAQEIDSRVIHDYKFFGAGYSYLHDIGDSEINAHGAIGAFSFEEQNFVLGVSGGYFWAEDNDDLNVWSVAPSLGYVVRLMENHLNIIPRVTGSYAELVVDDPIFGSDSEGSWSILPGIGVSYAINNQIAINAGYAWGYNFDSEEDDHFFNGGLTFAVAEQIGLSANALFSKEFGFSGVTAAVEFHY